MDALHFTSERYAVALHFHKGDIQDANNLSIFHVRGGFRDSKEKQWVSRNENHSIILACYLTLFYVGRHLLRLWLRDPEFEWEKHEALKERFDRVYADLKTENPVFLLEAIIRGADVGT